MLQSVSCGSPISSTNLAYNTGSKQIVPTNCCAIEVIAFTSRKAYAGYFLDIRS